MLTNQDVLALSVVFVSIVIVLIFAILYNRHYKKIERKWDEKVLEKRDEIKKISDERKAKTGINYDEILTACGDLGNVKDPLGVLHDENGNPILLNGERITGKSFNVHCSIGKRSHPIVGSMIFEDAGEGIFYRTNMRLIYVRTPQPDKHFRAGGILGAPTHAVDAIQAKEWRLKGRKEVASIPIRSVISCTKKAVFPRNGIRVNAKIHNKIYDIFFYPRNLVLPLIDDLLKRG